MFTWIMSSWRFKSSAAMLPREPKPALFTSTSMTTFLCASSSKISRGASGLVRSFASTCAVMPCCCCNSSASAMSRSPRRATSTRFDLSAANNLANSRPMPEDAPVISAVSTMMDLRSEWQQIGHRQGYASGGACPHRTSGGGKPRRSPQMLLRRIQLINQRLHFLDLRLRAAHDQRVGALIRAYRNTSPPSVLGVVHLGNGLGNVCCFGELQRNDVI